MCYSVLQSVVRFLPRFVAIAGTSHSYVLQCVALCCIVLQCAAVWCSVLQRSALRVATQCIACCRCLSFICVAVRCIVLQCGVVRSNLLQYSALRVAGASH